MATKEESGLPEELENGSSYELSLYISNMVLRGELESVKKENEELKKKLEKSAKSPWHTHRNMV